ncbi:NAC domain-containing protein 102 [Ricinus communis]|uniref:NAC domain-containing protein 102 n=1 Tax=Ricinus communis TaxID=3988 RepID=UPI00201AAC30|nr:NAC domain-containing protein 102 [Ricinus communis]
MDQFLATLPTGCRFSPTDEELVAMYLFKKTKNLNLSDVENMIVPVCDLYGDKEPWELWDQFSQNQLFTNGDLYFFTELKKKPKSSRISRRVGKGTWHGENKREPVNVLLDVGSAKQLMIQATKKRFNYRNQNSAHHCRWTLHEFSLDNVSTNWVLCRLRNNHVSDSVNSVLVLERVSSNGKNAEADEQCPNSEIVPFEKRLKTSDRSTVLVAGQESDSNKACIVVAEQDNGFVGGRDLPEYGSIANAGYEFENDSTYSELSMICYGSMVSSVSNDELFGNVERFNQGNVASADIQTSSQRADSDFASQTGQNGMHF